MDAIQAYMADTPWLRKPLQNSLSSGNAKSSSSYHDRTPDWTAAAIRGPAGVDAANAALTHSTHAERSTSAGIGSMEDKMSRAFAEACAARAPARKRKVGRWTGALGWWGALRWCDALR